jgi:hypothetical protein
MYSLYKFKTRGIGVVSTIDIPKDTLVGNYFSKKEQLTSESRLIYDGWIETNPLGRYLNHNKNSNLRFLKKDDVIEIYTNQNILKNTELTVDYTQIIKLINLSDSLVLAYEIFNYDYIEEEIVTNKNII